METADLADSMLGLHGEDLVAYIQQTLLLREHLNHCLAAPYSDQQIFTAALAHFPKVEAPTVVTMNAPQLATYWFHTGKRAYIVLANSVRNIIARA